MPFTIPDLPLMGMLLLPNGQIRQALKSWCDKVIKERKTLTK